MQITASWFNIWSPYTSCLLFYPLILVSIFSFCKDPVYWLGFLQGHLPLKVPRDTTARLTTFIFAPELIHRVFFQLHLQQSQAAFANIISCSLSSCWKNPSILGLLKIPQNHFLFLHSRSCMHPLSIPLIISSHLFLFFENMSSKGTQIL